MANPRTTYTGIGAADLADKMKFIIPIAFVFLAILLTSTCKVIDGGERGVLIRGGHIKAEALESGIYFKIPIYEKIAVVSTRIEEVKLDKAEGASKDSQNVDISEVLNFSIDPDKVVYIYSKIGDMDDLVRKVIRNINQGVVKTTISQFTAEEMITKRAEVTDKFKEKLTNELAPFGVIVVAVNLADVAFTPEYNKSIENKQIAQQQALQAGYLAEKSTNEAKAALEKAKGEANSQIEVARGQRDAQKLVMETLTPQILQKMLIERWNGGPQIMGGGNSQFIIPLPTLPGQNAQGTPASK